MFTKSRDRSESHGSKDSLNDFLTGSRSSLELRPVSTVRRNHGDSMDEGSLKSSATGSSSIPELAVPLSTQSTKSKTRNGHSYSASIDTSLSQGSNESNTDLDALDTDSTDEFHSIRDMEVYSDSPSGKDNDGDHSDSRIASGNNYIDHRRMVSPLTSLEFLPVGSSRNTESNEKNSSESVGEGITSEDSEDETDDIDTYDGEGDDAPGADHIPLFGEKKIGDEMPSVSQKVDNQDRLYETLNILNDVRKLREMKFFDAKYNEKMIDLKKAQVGMMVDMIQMNENSFREFYEVWDALEDRGEEEEREVEEEKEQKKHKFRKKKSEHQDKPLVHLDINESALFGQLGERNEVVSQDIDKIKDSVKQIDEYTKGLWDS
ncbi:hypothetical protein FOA43_000316 [Brettanomyces nanus]|uniref:Uncharacterized protein n=1 Tax=Eeniella nana TaxID=13502 RepID=A0A875RYM0_EENNA|nr:uncharacterized protein FOA43_000316 [Brettanomyces nanus]QPG73012.1 hypothetical protein FOA43_000316 [Brettanomyces nanus]